MNQFTLARDLVAHLPVKVLVAQCKPINHELQCYSSVRSAITVTLLYLFSYLAGKTILQESAW